MSSSFIAPEAYEPEPARRTLGELVARLATECAALRSGGRHAVRVEIPVESVDPQQWLRAQEDGRKVYWCDRGGAFEAAGIGEADAVAGAAPVPCAGVLDAVGRMLAGAHPHVRYYGGFRFDSGGARGDSPWARMGAYRFVLPRLEVLNAGGQSYLACNLVGGTEADFSEVLEAIEGLHFPEAPAETAIPRPLSRRDRPDRAEWGRTVARALDLFDRGAIEKIVLARESVFEFHHAPDPLAILQRLSARAARAYCFCFQPEPGLAFLGATPERLYARRGRLIESEAVAGTRRRGGSPDADDALGRELLASDKDMREHGYVVDALARGFAAICSAVKGHDETALLQLSECQHLYRRIEGILAEPHSDAAILDTLHPTPAVGGHPTAAALGYIAELEPFDRGWYAGPVGWVGGDGAEFAVALRCGLVHGTQFSVYSGAGIVAGSDADSEWDEIESKMGGIAGALNADDR